MHEQPAEARRSVVPAESGRPAGILRAPGYAAGAGEVGVERAGPVPSQGRQGNRHLYTPAAWTRGSLRSPVRVPGGVRADAGTGRSLIARCVLNPHPGVVPRPPAVRDEMTVAARVGSCAQEHLDRVIRPHRPVVLCHFRAHKVHLVLIAPERHVQPRAVPHREDPRRARRGLPMFVGEQSNLAHRVPVAEVAVKHRRRGDERSTGRRDRRLELRPRVRQSARLEHRLALTHPRRRARASKGAAQRLGAVKEQFADPPAQNLGRIRGQLPVFQPRDVLQDSGQFRPSCPGHGGCAG